MLASVLHLGMAQVGALAMIQSTSSSGGFMQSIWTTGTQSLSSSSMITTLTGLAYTILSVGLIGGVYGVFARGGDLRELIMLMVKTAVCGLLIVNWNTFFLTDVTTNGVFAIASSINSTDVFSALGTSLLQELKNDYTTLTGLGKILVGGGVLEIIQALVMVFGWVCYALAYGILAVAFTLFGTILYAMGPLLIATIPSGYFSQLGKTYVKSLVEWLSWPILFAIISELMSLLNLSNSSSSGQSLWANSPLSGLQADLLTAISTIIFSVMLVGLPWMAHKILNGDFAGSMGAAATQAMSAVSQAAVTAASAGAGAAMGGAGMLGGAGAGAGGATPAGASNGATPPPASPSATPPASPSATAPPTTPGPSGSSPSAATSGSGNAAPASSPAGSSHSGGSGSDDGGGGWSTSGAVAGALKGAFGGFGSVANAAANQMLKVPPPSEPRGPSESEAYDMAFNDK